MPAFNIILGADGFLECGPVGGSPRAVDPGIVYVPVYTSAGLKSWVKRLELILAIEESP